MNFNNPSMEVPEACIRFAFCFKRTLIIGKDGNTNTQLGRDLVDLIERSADELVYRHVPL